MTSRSFARPGSISPSSTASAASLVTIGADVSVPSAMYGLTNERAHFSGTPIGNDDLWIACHALAENATRVTNDVRELRRVGGLSLDDWIS